MTLISGKNGSGKSAIGEALTFGLFGVPFRNVNKPNIVNSINEKDCLVEIELCIGKKNYMIRRGIKPTIFEIYCDGKLIDQDSKSKDYQRYLEQNILKLNYKSFTQLVFLGSSNFVPFMQLTPQDRREVIEELLDIRVFSRMNVVLKEKQALVKEAIKDLEKNIDLVNSKLDIHKEYVESLNKKHEEDVKNWQEELSNVQKNHQLIENSLDDIEKDIQDKQQSIFDADKNKSKFNEYRQLELKLNEQLLKLEKSIEFYTSKNDCPTCNQIITNEFKEKEITKKKSKIETITNGMKDLQSEKDQITQRLEYITQTEKNILTLQLKQAEQRARLNALAEHINVLNSKINGGNSTKTYSKEEINKYDQIQKEYVACQQKKDDAIETKHIYDIVGEMLKDSGIKSKIIKQYLPVMNKLINKYLNAMDFFVNFNIDENFQEIIKSRYRDEFEYQCFQ
jgi:DNA repair exonuclease SbcCD ATPase subunit